MSFFSSKKTSTAVLDDVKTIVLEKHRISELVAGRMAEALR